MARPCIHRPGGTTHRAWWCLSAISQTILPKTGRYPQQTTREPRTGITRRHFSRTPVGRTRRVRPGVTAGCLCKARWQRLHQAGSSVEASRRTVSHEDNAASSWRRICRRVPLICLKKFVSSQQTPVGALESAAFELARPSAEQGVEDAKHVRIVLQGVSADPEPPKRIDADRDAARTQ